MRFRSAETLVLGLHAVRTGFLLCLIFWSGAVTAQSPDASTALRGSLLGWEGKFIEASVPLDYLLDRWTQIGRVQVQSDGGWAFEDVEVVGPVRWSAGGAIWRTWSDGGGEAFWALDMPRAADGPLGARTGALRQIGPPEAALAAVILEEAAVLKAAISDSARVWWQLQRTRLAPGLATTDRSLHAGSSSDRLLRLDSMYEAGMQRIARRALPMTDSTGRGALFRAFILADRWDLRVALNPSGALEILQLACLEAPAPSPLDAAGWLRARALWSLATPEDIGEKRADWLLAWQLNDLIGSPAQSHAITQTELALLQDATSHPMYGPSAQWILDREATRLEPTARIPDDLLFFYPNNETVRSIEFSTGPHLWLMVDASSPRAAMEIEVLHNASRQQPGPQIVVLDLGTDWDAFTALVASQQRLITGTAGQSGRFGAARPMIWLHAGGDERVMQAFDVHALPKVVETEDELVYKKKTFKLPSQGMRWPPK